MPAKQCCKFVRFDSRQNAERLLQGEEISDGGEIQDTSVRDQLVSLLTSIMFGNRKITSTLYFFFFGLLDVFRLCIYKLKPPEDSQMNRSIQQITMS